VDAFLEAVRATTDLSRPTIGLNYAVSFPDWMPGALNPNLGFFAYDGAGYALNSPEMLETMRIATELTTTGFTYHGLTYEQRELFLRPYAFGAFMEGQVAMIHDGTWLSGLFSRELDFEWDFIAVPGGRPVVTLDILGIASTTNHPEEAYLLARWMGHGVDGYLTRMEIASEMGMEIGSLPVSSDSRVLDIYWQMVNIPGLIAAYAHMDRAMIDGNKIIPGHPHARWGAATGIALPGTDSDNISVGDVFWHSILGNLNFPDHADVVNTVSNQELQRAMEALR
jgi:multiple sugar transport system substrate-binding protein